MTPTCLYPKTEGSVSANLYDYDSLNSGITLHSVVMPTTKLCFIIMMSQINYPFKKSDSVHLFKSSPCE